MKWKPVVDFFLYNVGKIAVEPKHTEYNYCKLTKTELILEPKTVRENRKTPMGINDNFISNKPVLARKIFRCIRQPMWLATECTGSKAHARGAADKDGIHKRWAASAEHHQIHGKKKKKRNYTTIVIKSDADISDKTKETKIFIKRLFSRFEKFTRL